MRTLFRGIAPLLLAALVAAGCHHSKGAGPPTPSSYRVLRLATTTSTRDSGLLEVLIPPFEKAQGARVDVVASGTGRALKLGERGDVDVLLVHARAAEDAFMAAGFGRRREDVMYNSFEICGPPGDPAGIEGLEPLAALKRIAAGHHRFLSRGDDSGTHKRERALWKAAGVTPSWKGYSESGQGMGASLVMADQLGAYLLTDSGTFLAFRGKVALQPLVTRGAALRNPYGVITVNPGRFPRIASGLAEAFADYLISPAAQKRIASYRVAGQQLFHPLHPPRERKDGGGKE